MAPLAFVCLCRDWLPDCLTHLTTDMEQWKITKRRTANLNSYVPLKPTCHLNWRRRNLQCRRRINFVLYTCLSLKSTSLSDWTVYCTDCSNRNLMHEILAPSTWTENGYTLRSNYLHRVREFPRHKIINVTSNAVRRYIYVHPCSNQSSPSHFELSQFILRDHQHPINPYILQNCKISYNKGKLRVPHDSTTA